MSLSVIESLLEKRIGLSMESISSDIIAKAVQSRMQARGIAALDAYLAELRASPAEWAELIELSIIPETWFFRNHQSFQFLRRCLKTDWLPLRSVRQFRALSLPCSTGEEPYSIGITALESGLPEQTITIDAVDVSAKGLQKACAGLYGRESFRNKELDATLRQRYFSEVNGKFQIQEHVRRIVRFQQGNLLDSTLLAGEKAYDVIFCRNVLIYLGSAAKQATIRLLDRLLAETGILFVGHAERPAFADTPFEWVQEPSVFACRRPKIIQPQALALQASAALNELPAAAPLPTPTFERRKQQPPAPATMPKAHASVAERRQQTDQTAAILNNARLLADQGQLNAAMTLCDDVLKTCPAHVQAHFLKGLIYQALRDEYKAEEWFNKTVYLDRTHDEALSYLAVLADYRGERERAALLRQRIERIRKKIR